MKSVRKQNFSGPFLLIGLVAIGLAVLAQLEIGEGHTTNGLVLYAVAALLMVLTLGRQSGPVVAVSAAPPLRLNPGTWIGLAVGLGAVVLAALSLLRFEPDPPPLSAWWMHLGSIALFVAAVLVLDEFSPESKVQSPKSKVQDPESKVQSPKSKVQDPESAASSQQLAATSHQPPATSHHPPPTTHHAEERPWSPTEVVALLGIVAIAICLRLYRFSDLPFGTWYDEAENGLQALRILNQPDFWPVFMGAIHAPAHYLYLIAAVFRIFGPSTEAIRAVSVIMGVGTVLAGYLAGRELFGRRILGLVLAFLLAVSSWAVNFSRIGMYNISTPLFELLTLGFLLRALRRQRLIDYALAGLSLGLGLSFYSAFQLFVPVVGLFLLYCLVVQRGFLRQSWRGLLVMGLATLFIVGPIALYAYHHPDVYFNRTQDTFIFADKSAEERWPALVENVRKHVLMFNVRGDPNGRHNLPGEPMLDPVAGALLVLGIGLSLARIYRPGSLLLLIWIGIMLLAGILSLDFEAPQSLRAIGTLPAAYVLAVAPISALWYAWRATRLGGRYPRLFVWPLLAGLLYVGFINYEAYFVRRAQDFASWNAFSTPESIAANILAEEGDEAEFYVISFLHGHPTLKFLARDAPSYQRLETTDHLPLRRSADRDIVLILNDESRGLYKEAQRYYPNATFEEHRAAFGGPVVLYYVRLTPEDIASLQGLVASYYDNTAWRGEPALVRKDDVLQFDWTNDPPVDGPFSVEWQGVLNIPRYGPHRLILNSPGDAELYLNEELLLEGSGEQSADVVLAQGNHALRLRTVGADGLFELAWQTPGGAQEVLPAWALYVPPVTNNGLLGRYYANGNWEGPETFTQIDPELDFYFHVPLLPRPYTVEWLGKIYIAQPGTYRFGLESIDESVLTIDDQEITASLEPNQYREGMISLDEGFHDIRVRFADRTAHTHINLYWIPPGGGQQHVPAQVLFPPQGSYEYVSLEEANELFRAVEPAPVTEGLPANALAYDLQTVTWDGLATDLASPRAVAASPQGDLVYVANGGHLLVLDAGGEVLWRIERGAGPFQEISDLAVDGEGQVYVLDAGAARLDVFDAQGTYLRTLAVPDTIAGRARGLAVDDREQIWIAVTPGRRVAVVDQNGLVVREFPMPAVTAQPVDVAVAADGDFYVTDAGMGELIHFDANGQALQQWLIPPANSVDGSHLAVDGDGVVFMSVPEQGALLRLPAAADGAEMWALTPDFGQTPRKPIGIALDDTGAIWTVDVLSGMVMRIFD